ncbi:ABC transporter substrate-binding protein [Sphingomonas quercus]|uniref:ABC transporter substrate-binding protein n=1 Tax=Sphingomonas quercus TaxID=2842451 RepID=A0ABS6BJK0_9SPHN|nr:ABC transporter substrate-binding protein [Sphingomonas quercus]MBU3077409.1 ABC transporter substrate-binding protein [Sphingomonas quercus]
MATRLIGSDLLPSLSWGITRDHIVSRFFPLLAMLMVVSLRADGLAWDYPQSYRSIVEAARQERELIIYSVVHADAAVADLLAAFRQRYPFIHVSNTDGDGARTYRRFKREIAEGRRSADFIWSSAMDLQEKLINDGLSQAYPSPQKPSLPTWAHWQDLGYGVTQEPIAFVYNSRYLAPDEMPRTHAGLRALLEKKKDRLAGRLAVYDPERSEVGMLLLSQDMRVTRDSWNLFDAFGLVAARGYSTSRDMLLNIVKGDQWIGYDVIASYAMDMQRTHPELVVVYPDDYVLMLSRVAIITANAHHPNSAKLFLDFMLSREGQTILKNYGMGSVRADIGVPKDQLRINPRRTQAIRIGPGLLSGLDSLIRAQFLRRWREARSGRS